MKHFYEMFLSASEDWDQSSIMYNVRRRSGKRKCGKYVWKTLQALKDEQLGCTMDPTSTFNWVLVFSYTFESGGGVLRQRMPERYEHSNDDWDINPFPLNRHY